MDRGSAGRAAGAEGAGLVRLIVAAIVLLLQCSSCDASEGDRDPLYRACLEVCEKKGCIDGVCFPACDAPVNGAVDGHQGTVQVLEEPIYLKIRKWDCPSECRYQCMVRRESERALAGDKPVKYHGKWPFQRLFGIQEPAAVAFSVLNLLVHVWGLSSFLVSVYHRLPLRSQGRKGPYYEYVGLWTIYALLSINSWFCSALFHTRDMQFTERLDYSSAIASLGFSLILSIFRTLNIRTEAARVMVSAPLIGFIVTHILYLNFYEFDYGLNMKVCVLMGVTQLLFWSIWAAVTRHPSRWKLWTVVLGTLAAMLLEIYDFPPLKGHFDAHSMWHLVTVPLTYLWWSFIKEDASVRTMSLLKRTTSKKAE